MDFIRKASAYYLK